MPADQPPQGGKPKVKPATALIVVAVAALGGVLWMRYKGSKPASGGTDSGTGTVTTSYGLGPEWFLTMVKDHQSPPNRKPSRKKFTDWQGHR